MGTSVSRYAIPVKDYVTGRKRKLEFDDSDEAMRKVISNAMYTPKRKKLRTAEYIYATLFKEGKNADVTVLALGKSFNLHKVYLCQSPYFASMFGGSWLESTKNFIPIEIVDPEITIKALDVVFGSLYLDEIVLEPIGIVAVLATATLFQLENIIDQCVEIMFETINPKTVVKYYEAACEYGVQKVKAETFKYLEVNLLTYFAERVSKMRRFSSNLLSALISSPNLFVVQTEFSAYLLIRSWLFVQISNGNYKDEEDLSTFFSSRKTSKPYLLTDLGQKFIKPFEALKLKNLLLHHMDIEVIHRDNIIPKNWLHPEIFQQWYSMLKINQNTDTGPKDVTEAAFNRDCLRCGRIVPSENKQMWRWTGFHFGLDLVIVTDGRALFIRRNHRSESEQMLSFQAHRNLIIRVTVATVDEQLQIKHIQSTGIKPISCTRNEEQPVLRFDKEIKFPLYISVNLLLTSSHNMDFSSLVINEHETRV